MKKVNLQVKVRQWLTVVCNGLDPKTFLKVFALACLTYTICYALSLTLGG